VVIERNRKEGNRGNGEVNAVKTVNGKTEDGINEARLTSSVFTCPSNS